MNLVRPSIYPFLGYVSGAMISLVNKNSKFVHTTTHKYTPYPYSMTPSLTDHSLQPITILTNIILDISEKSTDDILTEHEPIQQSRPLGMFTNRRHRNLVRQTRMSR
jgi:hypothetical protein